MFEEIYISTDIESNGPVAGVHSMLSIGSAAFTVNKELISTFSANIEKIPELSEDKTTMEWWQTQPIAWENCRSNLESPRLAMVRYLEWLTSLNKKLVFLGYPVVFDFSFVYWYLMKFTGVNPFGYSAIDIKTYAMAILRKPYRACGKTSMPPEWFDDVQHSHIALDDAIEQGRLFCNMLARNITQAK